MLSPQTPFTEDQALFIPIGVTFGVTLIPHRRHPTLTHHSHCPLKHDAGTGACVPAPNGTDETSSTLSAVFESDSTPAFPWPLTPALVIHHNSCTNQCWNRKSRMPLETVAPQPSQPRGLFAMSAFIKCAVAYPSHLASTDSSRQPSHARQTHPIAYLSSLARLAIQDFGQVQRTLEKAIHLQPSQG